MRTSVRNLLAASLVLATSSLCFAEQIDNPSYKAWAKFKPGTTVTLKGENDMAGNKTESEMTTTLVELTPEKAVVEMKMSMVMAGSKTDMPASKSDVPAKIEKVAADPAATPKADVKESSETIDIAGKKIKCKVTESKSDANGMNTVSKAWTSDEVPGGLAKSETTMSGAMAGTSKMSISTMTIK
jgi:hypothetical protein